MEHRRQISVVPELPEVGEKPGTGKEKEWEIRDGPLAAPAEGAGEVGDDLSDAVAAVGDEQDSAGREIEIHQQHLRPGRQDPAALDLLQQPEPEIFLPAAEAEQHARARPAARRRAPDQEGAAERDKEVPLYPRAEPADRDGVRPKPADRPEEYFHAPAARALEPGADGVALEPAGGEDPVQDGALAEAGLPAGDVEPVPEEDGDSGGFRDVEGRDREVRAEALVSESPEGGAEDEGAGGHEQQDK